MKKAGKESRDDHRMKDLTSNAKLTKEVRLALEAMMSQKEAPGIFKMYLDYKFLFQYANIPE